VVYQDELLQLEYHDLRLVRLDNTPAANLDVPKNTILINFLDLFRSKQFFVLFL
jgi:hypothetical protein